MRHRLFTAQKKKAALLALALAVLCAALPAQAAAPKAESLVSSDRITLGDVFEGVAENAGYYLAPAPEPGKTITLGAGDLLRISQAFKLGWAPGEDPAQTVIRRDLNEIASAEIAAAVRDRLAQELKGQKLDVELAGGASGLQIPAGADKTLSIEGLSFNAVRNEFRATASAGGARKEVTGRFYPLSRVPVLKEPLRQGEVIAASDIDYIEMRGTDITAAMIVDAEGLVGQSPRRSLPAMKPLAAGDVRLPLLIKKGDLVTMLLRNDVISLTAQGRALGSGAAGDAIPVMNTVSKQVIDAVVTGPQAVSIRPPANVF